MFARPDRHSFQTFWQVSQTDLIIILCFSTGSLTGSWLQPVPIHKLSNKKMLSANLFGNFFIFHKSRITKELIRDDRSGIRTVINLQTPGEHSHCGPPLTSSGFSYLPEIFMEKDSYIHSLRHIDIDLVNSNNFFSFTSKQFTIITLAGRITSRAP